MAHSLIPSIACVAQRSCLHGDNGFQHRAIAVHGIHVDADASWASDSMVEKVEKYQTIHTKTYVEKYQK